MALLALVLFALGMTLVLRVAHAVAGRLQVDVGEALLFFGLAEPPVDEPGAAFDDLSVRRAARAAQRLAAAP